MIVQETFIYPMPFGSLRKVTNVLCEDGKFRNAHIVSEPDTYFSIPAVVYVKGKTVRGFVSCDHNDDYLDAVDMRNSANCWYFRAYKYLKNAYLIPTESETK